MPSFQSAELTAPQYVALHGNHETQWFTVLNPNLVVFQARVNQAVFGISFAEVEFDTVTVGAYTAALEGFPVLISHTSSIRDAFFVGRVRKAPTSSILYINETSLAIQDSDYIFCIKDPHRLAERHPHQDESTGVLKWDFDASFRRLRPICRGVQQVYYVQLSGGNADIAITPDWFAPEAGASISSYVNTLDGGSFQTGNGTSEDYTVRYTAVGVYYPRQVATDSGGRTNYFTPMVIVDDAAHSVCTLGAKVNDVQRTLGEDASASLTVESGTDLSSVLDNTQVVCVSIASITPILTNIIFIGRLRDEDNQVSVSFRAGLTSSASFKLEGLMAQMGRLILASIAMRRTTASAVVGEVNALTLWRAITLIITELMNVSTFRAWSFDNESTDYGVPLLGTEVRSAGDSIGDIGFAINAFLKTSPDGAAKIVRHMAYLSASDKTALLNVANYGNADWHESLRISRQHVLSVGRVIGFGGSYNTSAGKTTALRAIAPSRVFSSGSGRTTINSQVLPINLSLVEMQAEIALRTGAEYAIKNQQTVMDVTLPSNYEYLFPAPDEVYTWTLSAAQTKTGRGYTTADKWFLQSVTLNHKYERHYTDVKPRWLLDSANIAAQVMAEVAPDELPWQVSPLVPFPTSPFPMLDSEMYDGVVPDAVDEQPYSPEEVRRATSPAKRSTDPTKPPNPSEDPSVKKGNVVAVANSAGLWIADNFTRTNSPNWRNVTPGTGINHFQWNKLGAGGWALADDATDSIVWRNDNLVPGTGAWNSLVLENAVYTLLAAPGLPGKLYAYAPSGTGGATFTDDLTAGLGPNTYNFGASFPFGVQNANVGGSWIGSGGRTGGGCIQGAMATGTIGQAGIVYDLGADYTVTHASFWGCFPATLPGSHNEYIQFYDASKVLLNGPDEVVSEAVAGTYVQFEQNVSCPGVRYVAFQLHGNASAIPVLDDISVTIDAGGNAITRYSTDNGATFASAVAAGDAAAAAAGFHARMGSDTVLAAIDEKVREATAGGSYSDATGGGTTGSYARCIFDYTFGSVTAKFLIAPAAAVGGETLFKVEAGVATAITPNDGVNDGVAVSTNCLCVAPDDPDTLFALMNFGGTVKLARSANAGASWAFTTVNAASVYVCCRNAQQVYVCGGSSIQYSEDGGANFVTKVSPGASLTLIEVR